MSINADFGLRLSPAGKVESSHRIGKIYRDPDGDGMIHGDIAICCCFTLI